MTTFLYKHLPFEIKETPTSVPIFSVDKNGVPGFLMTGATTTRSGGVYFSADDSFSEVPSTALTAANGNLILYNPAGASSTNAGIRCVDSTGVGYFYLNSTSVRPT